MQNRLNRNTQQYIQNSLQPRTNRKIVDKVDNKGCFVWSFNLQKNKKKMREGKEVDKQKRNQTNTGKRVNEVRGFDQWLNEKYYNQPPTVDIKCSLWNMQKNKKKNKKKKSQHANPKQTTGGAMNKRNGHGEVSKTKKHQVNNLLR